MCKWKFSFSLWANLFFWSSTSIRATGSDYNFIAQSFEVTLLPELAFGRQSALYGIANAVTEVHIAVRFQASTTDGEEDRTHSHGGGQERH